LRSELPRQGLVRTLGWTALALVAIDVVLSFAFAMPESPREEPGLLQRYFDNGRSTEAKLRYLTRPTDAESAPILPRGWLDAGSRIGEPATRGPGERVLVAIYGMSHARRLGRAVQRVAPDVAVRNVTAPGATPNWSYAAWESDRGAHRADAVVLSILSLNVPMLAATAAATAQVDVAMPYTMPRYRLEAGGLRAVAPPFESLAGYRAAVREPERWRAWRDHLQEHDPFFHPAVFDASLLDHSTVLRAVRRGFASRLRGPRVAEAYDPATGFRSDSEAIQVLFALVRRFDAQARADGLVPVVYLVNSLGTGDSLYRVLSPVLEAGGVPTLSSHTVVRPDDPSGYLPDSHFLDVHDDSLARRLIEIVDRERGS